jgi:hypothetical protein
MRRDTHWRISIALIATYLLTTIVRFVLFLSTLVGLVLFLGLVGVGLSEWAWRDIDEPTDV